MTTANYNQCCEFCREVTDRAPEALPVGPNNIERVAIVCQPCRDYIFIRHQYQSQQAKLREAQRAARADDRAAYELPKRLLKGGIEGRELSMTMGNYEPPNAHAANIHAQLANYNFKSNLIILGSCGVGKSHLVCALVNAYALSQPDCTFLSRTLNALCRQYRSNFAELGMTESNAFDSIAGVGLLGIHDADSRELTSAERAFCHDLFDARWKNRRPTLITANCSVRQFSEAFGDAILSRLYEDAFVFDDGNRYAVLQHADYRRNRP